MELIMLVGRQHSKAKNLRNDTDHDWGLGLHNSKPEHTRISSEDEEPFQRSAQPSDTKCNGTKGTLLLDIWACLLFP